MDSFFGIGLPELILILVIAGIFMGPERIGHLAKWLGKTTAQLQGISRGFVRQLQNELEGVEGGEALQEAMTEMQALRQELESMRSEFTSITETATNEGKEALAETENSILPPTLTVPPPEANGTQPALKTADETADETAVDPPVTAPKLPNIVEIEDDPE